MKTILRRCQHTGCRQLVHAGLCPTHRHQKNQTYGRQHRNDRARIMAAHGWACHYCGHPVTIADDIAHLGETSRMTPRQAQTAPRVPAHRACHNENAPHLSAR
jgi:hypothetical protein